MEDGFARVAVEPLVAQSVALGDDLDHEVLTQLCLRIRRLLQDCQRVRGNGDQLHCICGDRIAKGIGDHTVDLAACSGGSHHVVIGIVTDTGFDKCLTAGIAVEPLVAQSVALGDDLDHEVLTQLCLRIRRLLQDCQRVRGNGDQLHCICGDRIAKGIGDHTVDLAAISGDGHHIVIGIVTDTGLMEDGFARVAEVPLVLQTLALGNNFRVVPRAQIHDLVSRLLQDFQFDIGNRINSGGIRSDGISCRIGNDAVDFPSGSCGGHHIVVGIVPDTGLMEDGFARVAEVPLVLQALALGNHFHIEPLAHCHCRIGGLGKDGDGFRRAGQNTLDILLCQLSKGRIGIIADLQKRDRENVAAVVRNFYRIRCLRTCGLRHQRIEHIHTGGDQPAVIVLIRSCIIQHIHIVHRHKRLCGVAGGLQTHLHGAIGADNKGQRLAGIEEQLILGAIVQQILRRSIAGIVHLLTGDQRAGAVDLIVDLLCQLIVIFTGVRIHFQSMEHRVTQFIEFRLILKVNGEGRRIRLRLHSIEDPEAVNVHRTSIQNLGNGNDVLSVVHALNVNQGHHGQAVHFTGLAGGRIGGTGKNLGIDHSQSDDLIGRSCLSDLHRHISGGLFGTLGKNLNAVAGEDKSGLGTDGTGLGIAAVEGIIAIVHRIKAIGMRLIAVDGVHIAVNFRSAQPFKGLEHRGGAGILKIPVSVCGHIPFREGTGVGDCREGEALLVVYRGGRIHNEAVDDLFPVVLTNTIQQNHIRALEDGGGGIGHGVFILRITVFSLAFPQEFPVFVRHLFSGHRDRTVFCGGFTRGCDTVIIRAIDEYTLQMAVGQAVINEGLTEVDDHVVQGLTDNGDVRLSIRSAGQGTGGIGRGIIKRQRSGVFDIEQRNILLLNLIDQVVIQNADCLIISPALVQIFSDILSRFPLILIDDAVPVTALAVPFLGVEVGIHFKGVRHFQRCIDQIGGGVGNGADLLALIVLFDCTVLHDPNGGSFQGHGDFEEDHLVDSRHHVFHVPLVVVELTAGGQNTVDHLVHLGQRLGSKRQIGSQVTIIGTPSKAQGTVITKICIALCNIYDLFLPHGGVDGISGAIIAQALGKGACGAGSRVRKVTTESSSKGVFVGRCVFHNLSILVHREVITGRVCGGHKCQCVLVIRIAIEMYTGCDIRSGAAFLKLAIDQLAFHNLELVDIVIGIDHAGNRGIFHLIDIDCCRTLVRIPRPGQDGDGNGVGFHLIAVGIPDGGGDGGGARTHCGYHTIAVHGGDIYIAGGPFDGLALGQNIRHIQIVLDPHGYGHLVHGMARNDCTILILMADDTAGSIIFSQQLNVEFADISRQHQGGGAESILGTAVQLGGLQLIGYGIGGHVDGLFQDHFTQPPVADGDGLSGSQRILCCLQCICQRGQLVQSRLGFLRGIVLRRNDLCQFFVGSIQRFFVGFPGFVAVHTIRNGGIVDPLVLNLGIHGPDVGGGVLHLVVCFLGDHGDVVGGFAHLGSGGCGGGSNTGEGYLRGGGKLINVPVDIIIVCIAPSQCTAGIAVTNIITEIIAASAKICRIILVCSGLTVKDRPAVVSVGQRQVGCRFAHIGIIACNRQILSVLHNRIAGIRFRNGPQLRAVIGEFPGGFQSGFVAPGHLIGGNCDHSIRQNVSGVPVDDQIFLATFHRCDGNRSRLDIHGGIGFIGALLDIIVPGVDTGGVGVSKGFALFQLNIHSPFIPEDGDVVLGAAYHGIGLAGRNALKSDGGGSGCHRCNLIEIKASSTVWPAACTVIRRDSSTKCIDIVCTIADCPAVIGICDCEGISTAFSNPCRIFAQIQITSSTLQLIATATRLQRPHIVRFRTIKDFKCPGGSIRIPPCCTALITG